MSLWTIPQQVDFEKLARQAFLGWLDSKKFVWKYEEQWAPPPAVNPGTGAPSVFEVTSTASTGGTPTIAFDADGFTMTSANTSGNDAIFTANDTSYSTTAVTNYDATAYGNVSMSVLRRANFFNTSSKPFFSATLKFPSSLASKRFMFGLYTAAADESIHSATAVDDGALLEFVPATDTYWRACTVTGDSSVATEVLRNAPAPTASGVLNLAVVIDSDRKPHYLINGVQYHVGGVLDATTALVPVIAVATTTSATASLTIVGNPVVGKLRLTGV